MRAWLRGAVSVALVALALYLLDWQTLAGVAGRTSLASFAAAVVLVLVSFAFLALRWLAIIAGSVTLPARESLRVYFHASFFNSFTPANIGGDVYRASALKSHAPGLGVVLLALLRERLFGLLSFLVGYGACLGLLRLGNPAAYAQLDPLFDLALVPVLIAVLALTASAPVLRRLLAVRWIAARARLSRLLEEIGRAMVLHSPGEFLLLLALSALALIAWIGAVGIIAANLGVALALPLLGAIAVLTELVRLVPVSLQGIGIREGSFSVLVGLAGGSPESGFVLGAWSYLALSLALLACGPIAWLMSVRPRD